MSVCSMPKPEEFMSLTEYDFMYLNLQKSLSEKIYATHNLLNLSKEEIYERSKIVTYITDLLKPYYPECEVIVFGSSLNGFGSKGCDLDLLFLPFPGYCNLDFKEWEDEIVPAPHRVLSGDYPRKKLYLMSEVSHLKFVRKIMNFKRYYFKNIIFIPAKCPILKIEFFNSTISCDFSASNRLVVNNTELLWIFGKLHPSVKPLVMLLRYWAKSLGFISKSHLSSYSFTVLVIFYLQNTHPPVLPSVQSLQALAGYSRKVAGWETAICTDVECINAYREQAEDSISHHLIMFFDFYWQFNFIQNVVSPYFGKVLPVKELKTSEDERVRDFPVTAFSIQDPFDLSRNVSRNASMKTTFKLALLIAKRLLLYENFSFEKFFDLSYYQQEMDSMFSCIKNNFPSVFVSHLLQLNYDLCLKLGAGDNWFEKACQAVLDILQYGLLIECEVVDKTLLHHGTVPHPCKRRKVSGDHSSGDLEFIMCIQCTVNLPTLWHRKNIVLQSDSDEEESEADLPSALIKEYRISKQLAKAQSRPKIFIDPDEGPLFRFTCNIFRYRFSQISDIIVGFYPLTNANIFAEVNKALVAFVRKHAESVLRGD